MLEDVIPDGGNLCIVVTGRGTTTGFSCLMVDTMPDLGLLGSCQCFPYFLYDIQDKVSETPNV